MTNDHPAERARYLVELAAPKAGWEEIERIMRRARASTDAAGGARFIRTIFVPEDSRFYLLYEADSAEQARVAAARAELEVAGTVEALQTGQPATWQSPDAAVAEALFQQVCLLKPVDSVAATSPSDVHRRSTFR